MSDAAIAEICVAAIAIAGVWAICWMIVQLARSK